MATPQELRTAIGEAQTRLRAALEASGARWDDPVLPPEGPEVPGEERSGESWTPRRAAEHVMSAQLYHAALVFFALGRAPYRLDAPDRTAAIIDAWAEAFEALLAGLDPDDLAASVSLSEGQHEYMERHGVPPLDTVEGVLGLCAAHIADHARQLERVR